MELGPGKQRAVLAVLLLNANRPTPTTTIIDAVWGDNPPENGANVVQKYVAGLRRVLEPGRSARTPWRTLTLNDAGYALHIEPGHLDVDAFEQRVRQARAARAQDRPADAVEDLRAALALWRGPALAGLNGPLFDSARDRLAEDRTGALEECLETELELGHHDRLVPELVRLVAEFPMRERLRYLLILALYRCGRQAEALAAFREARAFLTEEFGVEPGDRLQQLHLSILRGDPALAATSGKGGPATSGEAGPVTPTADTGLTVTSAPPADHLRPPAGAPAVPLFADPDPAPPVVLPAMAYPPMGWVNSWPPMTAVPPVMPGGTRAPLWLRRIGVITICLGTLGFFGWAVIAYYAGRRRSRALALAAVGYFVCAAAFWWTVQDPELRPGSPKDQLAMVEFLISAAGAAAHAVFLVPGPAFSTAPELLDALEGRVRRRQALTLVGHYPAMAHELRIGRPDLPRVFDDGGLIDVNAVPEPVLATLPGVTAYEAWRIVADRQAHGAFPTVDSLVARGLLSAPVAHALRERLIVIRVLAERPESDAAWTV
jgi:DNA-binding SARP family transcriptional activator